MLKVLSPTDIKGIFDHFSKVMPEPKTELVFDSHFQLLIAVMLSAQATDVSVNRATKGLFLAAPDAKLMFALGEAGIRSYLSTLNFYRNKSRYAHLIAKSIHQQHGGVVPENRESLEALPGVGRKSANVVLNSAFGHALIAVDTHVFRVGNRTGLAVAKTVVKTEEKLIEVIPKKYLARAHHWLVLHGRYVCTAKKPKCGTCQISQYCAMAKNA